MCVADHTIYCTVGTRLRGRGWQPIAMTAALDQLGTSTRFAAYKSLWENNFELSLQHTANVRPRVDRGNLGKKGECSPFPFCTPRSVCAK
jgi:hypothetical protein